MTGSASSKRPPKRIEFPLNCTIWNTTKTRPSTNDSSDTECPEYFRWIHEDLKPWQRTGITREMVERAKKEADIRIVVVDGKVYYEKYKPVFQTRDVFTMWGILQLLRLYPGRLPDLDIMIGCDDKPVIFASDYQGAYAMSPPPLFHYCGDDKTLDIVFPDWSFWEINIKPWEPLREDLDEGNNRTKWVDREPYAFWKGNIKVGKRKKLVKCMLTDKKDWNARIYFQDWFQETQKGFTNSNLADQCTHRYKIYMEGVAWSVSEKYILACDSMTLLVKPQYHDFFSRSLLPLKHYWPINDNDLCNSIKFAVDWGNNHSKEAEEIGKEGRRFIQEELQMKHVYDYMFHLFSQYARLLKYKPSVPPEAMEACCCTVPGLEQIYKMETMVKSPAITSPCKLPPFDPQALEDLLSTKEDLLKQVMLWETNGVGEEAPYVTRERGDLHELE
ncbi:Glycosyl transferase CAP10 domain [Dillenia turbinata]|uniref:Glycosyl transferase CAP10 domain n=1 Tax=Dillenia turbinata TaxID=194707 RepID=A0AAN8UQ36_9MAGN